MEGLRAKEVRVKIRAEGFRPLTQVVARGHPVVLQLEQVFEISGIVVDRATQLPVADIRVLARENLAPSAAAETDAEGRFTLPNLGAGPYTLQVGPDAGEDDPQGYVRELVESVDGGTDDLRIELEIGLEISGRVLDAAGVLVTHPVRLSVLGRTEQGGPDYSRRRHLDVSEDGTFRVGSLPAGVYDLAFTVQPPKEGEPAPTCPTRSSTGSPRARPGSTCGCRAAASSPERSWTGTTGR